jgi:hypothetical protein
MPKITPDQVRILQHLLHEEPFQRLQEELKMHEGALRDDLRQLVAFGYIHSRAEDASTSKPFEFDTDFIQKFHYRATAKGLAVSKLAR